MTPDAAAWTSDLQALWRRVEAHPFEDASASLDFAGRLARTMGWSRDQTRMAIDEYRRFCFLAAISPTPVTPSEEIDEIWHLHLTYSRDYWQRWCGEILGCSLHHDPTVGGRDEYARFCRQYAETLALYERFFGPPDARLWPSLRARFRRRTRYRLVDTDRHFVLPRPSWRPLKAVCAAVVASGLVLLTTSTASAGVLDVLDWTGEAFLSLYLPLVLGAFLVAMVFRVVIAATGKAADSRGLSAVQLAFMAGGITRACDTYFMELATNGAARLTGTPPELEVVDARALLPREVQVLGVMPPGLYSRARFLARFGRLPGVRRLPDELARRNLVLGASGRVWRDLLTFVPIAPVLMLGLAKTIVGIQRGKPVGFLLAILVVATLAFVVLERRGHQTTRAGKGVLARLRGEYQRLIRAPRDKEVPLAFAFAGAAALAGTAYASYEQLIQTSSSSSGGDGGGGCGGGGCGGCGS